jgi:hypothetical protein
LTGGLTKTYNCAWLDFRKKESTTTVNTQGEAESQIGSDFSKFYSRFGKGPKSIRVNSINSIVVVITQNLLTHSERSLISSDAGCQMVKDIRKGLVDSSVLELKKIVSDATGEESHNLHHDFSTTDGEESFVFSLDRAPSYRLNNNGKSKPAWQR